MQTGVENKYGVRKLAEGLWTIEEAGVRCFLICDGGEAMLIDACASGGAEFQNAVRSVIGDTPVSIALTHADFDHMAGISPKDSPSLHPAEFERYRKNGPTPADGQDNPRAVRDGDVLSCGKRRLEVLHIPGHTPGSIALLDADNRCIFAGDTISTAPVYMFGEGRNLGAYIDSLARMESVADRFDRFYCPHGAAEAPVSQLAVQKQAAEQLLAGGLAGAAAPFDVGAGVKLYKYKGAAFFYECPAAPALATGDGIV